MPRHIVVIGDSAAASVGTGEPVYAELLPDLVPGADVINASAIGMTSTDAVEVFRDLEGELNAGDAVVLHLGNCDAAGYGMLKPRIWPGRLVRRVINRVYPKLNGWAVRAHPRSLVIPEAHMEMLRCVSPEDFAANIRAILARCARRKIQGVVIKPAINRQFPPCNHTPNSLFFRIAGGDERFVCAGSDAAPDATVALRAERDGDVAGALTAYRKLAAGGDATLAALANNNIAAIEFRNGNVERAMGFLSRALSHSTPLRPVCLFNKSILLRDIGFDRAAQQILEQAADLDFGTYRVTSAYREALDRVVDGFPADRACVVDMEDCLEREEWMDYCHPTPAAHRRIAAACAARIGGTPERQHGTVTCRYVNPDCSVVGGCLDFFQHFDLIPDTDLKYSTKLQTAGHTYRSLIDCYLDGIPDGVKLEQRALFILLHPVIGLREFLTRHPPELGSDQSPVPGFYFLRITAGLYLDPSIRAAIESRSGRAAAWMPRPGRIQQWARALRMDDQLVSPLDTAATVRLVEPAIVQSRVEMLLDAMEPDWRRACDRWRTSRSWFFREALQFGTASSPYSLTDRSLLAAVIDSCALLLATGSGPYMDVADAALRRFESACMDFDQRVAPRFILFSPDIPPPAHPRPAVSERVACPR